MGTLTAGIVATALALPRTRVATRGGLVAAAAPDEDVVTLSVRAALPVVETAGASPAALLLATVSSPFAEGGAAQVTAEALDLQGDLHVQEHGGTVAAGGAALASAAALLAAGVGPVLLVAADVRRDERGRALGDGALAVLLSADDDGGGRVTLLGSRAELFRDRWRRDGAVGVSDVDRSLRRSSPARAAAEAFALEGAGPPVLVEPDGPAVERVGVLGTPHLLTAALLALADHDPGATLRAAVSAGGVTHAFAVAAGPRSGTLAAELRAEIDAGVEGPWPSATTVEGFDPYASQPRSWRERGQDLRLEGQRDPDTGEVLYPPVPAAAAGGLEPYRLARQGTVVAVTRDHVFPYGGPLTMAVVTLDGGGRFFGQVADGRDVAIGDPVELVLRRLHDGGGLPHYFWKIQPHGGDTAGTG